MVLKGLKGRELILKGLKKRDGAEGVKSVTLTYNPRKSVLS